jgi:hypothetical protein
MEKSPIEVPMFSELVYPVIRNLLGRIWLTRVLLAPFKEIFFVEC